MALGFTAALRRPLSAIWASCSSVVPYRCMWARAYMAIQHAADAAPNGNDHSIMPVAWKSLDDAASLPIPTAARPPLPCAVPSHTDRKHTTWLHRPAPTARHALITEP